MTIALNGGSEEPNPMQAPINANKPANRKMLLTIMPMNLYFTIGLS